MITAEIVDEILKILKDHVYKIVLYGSYARGDFNLESDIDIMIILNCDREQVKALKELSDYRMEQAKRCIQSTKLLKLFYIVK